MPNDIRSFFGGKPSGAPAPKAPAKEEPPKRGRAKKSKVVEDSDDEEEVAPKKVTPKKAAPKPKKVESPKETATSTSDYFGASSKPKRTEPVKAKPAPKSTTATPKKATPSKPSAKSTPAANGQGTPIRTKSASQSKVVLKDEIDNDDDIFKSNFKSNGRKDDYEESEEEEMDIAPPKKATAPRSTKQSKVIKDEDDFEPDDDIDMKDADPDDDFVVDDDDEVVKPKKASKATKAAPAKKRKSPPESDEDEPPKKGRKTGGTAKSPAKKTPVKKPAKKDQSENATTQAIFDSITKVRAPTPPPRDGNKAFNYAAMAQHQNALSQSSGGQVDIPTGADNCLAGLNFVFTGVLPDLDRTTGQNLVKQYGGKCQSSASTRTDFVVLGADAGPKKLEVIRDNKLKTIDAQGLMELIRKMPANGGSGKAAEAYKAKQDKEQEKIKKMAEDMEKEEKKLAKPKPAAPATTSSAKAPAGKVAPSSKLNEIDTRLWTTKYAPTTINQICGNKGQVEKLQRWLRNFPKNQRKQFKLPGPDGSGTYRAVIIHGPPGIGKTTAAHVVAKEEGYDIVETNASDTRSKKLMEQSLRGILDTTSLMGYFSTGDTKVEGSKKKMVLIMDEVDGMTGSDRGGVGALAKVCKTSEIPMILICNDRRLPKMKPFDYVTYDMQFRRPTTEQIRARMMSIAYKEKLNMPPQVVNALIEGSGADIRQVVNMLSTSKLDQAVMDFDKSKEMSKAWEKHVILKPWDIVGKILGGAMWAESSKATLNEKSELYFNDHEFSYLMLQENYLGTFPVKANGYSGKEKTLKTLELVSNAADSISDGDLVDRMIHGSQQQWGLMPTHAMFSFVRPASYVAGALQGYGSTRFTSWLGQNSKQGKMSRYVKEIQGHMRLRSTGDRHEIRQQYVPALWSSLVQKLQVEGKDAVPSVIDLMDSYYLTRDDWDAVLELGVGRMDMEKVKIETQAKATFTRLYNAASHPMPFVKASASAAVSGGAGVKRERPDLEEAVEVEDEDAGAEPDGDAKKDEEDEELDLKKDKYIKAPKKKAAPKAGAKGAKKGKKAAEEEDVDMESEEEKPKKKGRAKAKAKN